MKKYNYLLLFVWVVGIFSACYKSSNWLDDNVTGGKFYPNVFFNTLDSATYTKGLTVRCNIEYWSQDPIKEIRFYDSVGSTARRVVATIPYAPAYSAFKKSDTLVYQYTVPISAAANTTIRLDAEVVNQNGLTRISNRPSFRVK